MVKKILFSFVFALLVFLPFKVNAYTNLDTTVSFDIYEQVFSSSFFNDSTYHDLLTYLSSLDTTYKDISITYSIPYHRIKLSIYPKNTITKYYINLDSNGLYIYPSSDTVSRLSVRFDVNTNYDFFGSSVQTKIEECLNNNNCWNTSSNYFDNSVYFGTDNRADTFQSNAMLSFNNNITLDNNSSYLLEDYSVMTYFYYSSMDNTIYYPNDNTSYNYIKKIIINGIELSDGDSFPTYSDLYLNTDNYLYNLSRIPSYSIGGISKNDISNFKLDITTRYSSLDYIRSLQPYIYYFGRSNNNTYYSYSRLNCTALNNKYSITYDDFNAYLTVLDGGFTCSDDLTNIDNIYIHIDFNYDTSYNSFLYNIKSNVSKGYFTINDPFTSKAKKMIYEKFDDLSYNSSIVFSTLSDSTSIIYNSNNSNSVLVNIDKSNNKVGQTAYDEITLGLMYNTNAMLFNYPSDSSPDVSYELYFDEDIILSLSDNNSYTYYDNNNSLTTNTIDNNVIISFNNSYDTQYYNNVVSSYIDSLSDSILELGNINQIFYNSIPDIFKTFIYVIFIIFCFYFTYLIIKR